MSMLPIDKFSNFFKAIRSVGGVRKAVYNMFRMDDVKPGVCVGRDKYGNTYWENKDFFYGRNRWIVYAEHYYLDYDGSQVPAEWYGWLHYKTDFLPSQDPGRPKHRWMTDHVENLTGTPGAYTPYSTTLPKIEAWDPEKRASQ